MTDWLHAPVHRVVDCNTFMVTAGTYLKEHHFRGRERLDLVQDKLFALAGEYGWNLHAWAIFSNHYHFIADSQGDLSSLRNLVKQLHASTAVAVNQIDAMNNRKVWFQYWDSALTYEKSYLARLKYVHTNPVHHGLAYAPENYPWCSAAWFEHTADASFRKTVMSFKIDRLNVSDEYDILLECGREAAAFSS